MLLISWLCLRCTRRVLLPVLFLATFAAAVSADELLELPTLPGYTRAATRDLNNRGQAVGQARGTVAQPRLPVLWSKRWSSPHTVETLPVLDGMVDGDAGAIARSGIPVGFSSVLVSRSTTFFCAVLWKKVRGEWEAVELEPPLGYTDAIAADVNSRGQAVGWAFNPNELVNGEVVLSAVVWQPSRDGAHTVVVLETPEGFRSTATGINELGDIVGRAYRSEVNDTGTGTFERSDVVVWRRVPRHHGLRHKRHPGSTRTPVILPSVPGFPTNTDPAINLFGHVTATARGLVDGTVSRRPVFWKRQLWKRRGPAYKDPVVLPIAEGLTDWVVTGINVSGRVVGSASLREGGGLRTSSAVLWRHRRRSGWTGQVLESPEGATFVSGTGLNDLGSVVGTDLIPTGGSSGAQLWKRDWKWHWKSRWKSHK